MAINPEKDLLLTFAQAARLVPKANGRTAHATALWRWARQGKKTPSGTIYLEAIRQGSDWFTTKEAVQTFLRDLELAREPGDHRAGHRAAVRRLREKWGLMSS